MGKTLRLGLAMGGGVSLGTFNGAALGQALKLLIARGGYDDVVIDVFSGASAGSMSLALMLRSLVHSTPAQRQAARAVVEEEFEDEWPQLGRKARANLVAAQVMKTVQEEVWVDRIDLELLLGDGQDLRHKGSLLDRGAVDALAEEYILWNGPITVNQRRLLADRVLFASTLTSLTGSIADARKEFAKDDGALLGLLDGMRSKLHSELRVFDLNFAGEADVFQDEDRHPRRWFRYHVSARRDGSHGTLLHQDAWRRIAATSIACGAFPFAFEPVVLTRKDFEYPEGRFPVPGRTEYPFTYVDGGFFNNEPIREAYRLASFMDALQPEGDFERCILFVDPNVENPPPALRVPVHQRWFLQDPNVFGEFDGVDLRRRGTLDRLLPQLGQIVGMLVSQGARIEGDKVFQTRNLFQLRAGIRELLHETLTSEARPAPVRRLWTYCRDQLARYRRDAAIPPTSVTLATELKRVIHEEDRPELLALVPACEAFAENPATAADDERHLWLRVLTFVAVDLIMDLTGKQEDARLVAIAPYTRIDNAQSPKPYELPGGAVAGFAGFTDPAARAHDVEVGEYCADMFLQHAGLIPERPLGPFPQFGARKRFLKRLRKGMDALGDRVSQAARTSHLFQLFPGLDGLILRFVGDKLDELVEAFGKPSREASDFEFRVFVGTKDLEFDGPGVIGDRDIHPVEVRHLLEGRTGKGRYLITRATHVGRNTWQGHHVSDDGRWLEVDKDGLGRGYRIRLPDRAQRGAALLEPNPVFVAGLHNRQPGDHPATLWQIHPGVTPLEERLQPRGGA